MVRDVVLTAYACSAQAPCSLWARQLFDEEPIVLAVPGTPGNFLRKGRQWAATGDAFRAALRELDPRYKDVGIRRRALVTFSGGWALTHNILLQPREQDLLDACILEDGLHSDEMDHWVNFAKRAAGGMAWMMMAHSQVTPPYASSKVTNEIVFRRAINEGAIPKCKGLPDYLLNPEIPKEGIRIPVSAVKDATGRVVMPAETKFWDKDCLVSWANRGNLYLLEYEGGGRPDPLYIAWVTAPHLWRMLADHWNHSAGPRSADARTPT